jgi:RNA polymerase sigma-70 factor (ECF subfamily)
MQRKVAGRDEPARDDRFEQNVVAHLDAAYNLARWLARDEHEAEDVVQEACLRAFKFIGTFHGGSARAWLLTIVRNTFYSQLKRNRAQALNVAFVENSDSPGDDDDVPPGWDVSVSEDVSRGLEREDAKRIVQQALARLPAEFREIIILRELEDLSYKEIAVIAQIPIGTVMSRLSRARRLLVDAMKISEEA